MDNWPMPSQRDGTVNVTVVLFVGEDDVSCYQGIGPPEWVATYGARLNVRNAERFFPQIRAICLERGWTFNKMRVVCAADAANEAGGAART